VYVPAGFEMGDEQLGRFLLESGAGDLITHGASGLMATLVPFIYDAAAGARGVLRGHLARNNEQWKTPGDGEALVILRGPDTYISPSWYATKQEHGRVVPTWNYVTAHVYGELRVHDDIDFVRSVVRDLTDKHEAGREPQWSVDDAPARYVDGLLRAIVGVELVITRVHAKAKLSQNRPADIDGVVLGLREAGEHRMADEVESHRPSGS
jgi:transcriptional regulator